MQPVIRKMLTIVVGGYLGVCLLLYLFQRRLIYFPGPPPETTPASAFLKYEDLRLPTLDGETIHAWHIRSEGARGAVIESHGNAGNMAQRLFRARVFLAMGLDVFLYDYRGYGSSSGSPGEPGLFHDAQAVFEHATGAAGFAPEQIICFGESLGGSVAADLASKQPVAALILESSFTSVPDLGAELYPWLPVRLLSRDRLSTLERIAEVKSPILIMHGKLDEVVPFAHSQRLLAAGGERAEFFELEGLYHNDGGFTARVEGVAHVAEFAARALGPLASD